MESTVAKVKAVNAAHAYAIELYKQYTKVFTPLVGQKIFKADGGLLAKYEKLLPKLPNTSQLSVYRYWGNYSLMWVVKTNELIKGESSCLYYETSVYIGEVSGDTLTKMCEPEVYRTDWTVEEVLTKRENLKNAEKVVSAIRSSLHPFGDRYDN